MKKFEEYSIQPNLFSEEDDKQLIEKSEQSEPNEVVLEPGKEHQALSVENIDQAIERYLFKEASGKKEGSLVIFANHELGNYDLRYWGKNPFKPGELIALAVDGKDVENFEGILDLIKQEIVQFRQEEGIDDLAIQELPLWKQSDKNKK